MDEAQRQFIADAQEIVEKLDRDLEQLRAFRFEGPKRRELAARIFRRVHTLKGSAASLGLEVISRVAHEFESVLDGVRLGRIVIDESLLNLFDEAANVIAQALSDAPAGGDQNASALIARLQAIATTSVSQGKIASTLRAKLPPDIASSLSEYDLQHAREAVREGAKLFIVSAVFKIEDFDQNFRELSRSLGQIGEVIATVPGEATTTAEIGFRLLYAAEVVPEEMVQRSANLGRIGITELKIEPGAISRTDEPASVARMPSDEPAAFVRIDLSRLDQIISDASELFRDATNALSAARESDDRNVAEAPMMHLQRRFIDLEERIIKLRLVPLADVLERTATRAGRIAARQLGKEIEFEIVGGDVEIDRPLADVLREPLLHLVRNAVDHGIETPEERVAAGKSPTGKVKLSAFSEGSRIEISVSDDGRGIDLDRIAFEAAQHGIANRALTMDQCLRLIFRPGFSTAAEVSELSGRGIGLDVVDRAMEQTGGEVRVATEPGVGTTFVLRLPAALALVQCLIVRSGDQYYCVESARVSDHGALELESRTEVNEAGVINWKGESLPAISLQRLLAQSRSEGSGKEHHAIIWQAASGDATPARGGDKFALVVDGIKGEHETLVRGLGRYAVRWPGISGAAELSDGNVALVLDLRRLIEAHSESY